MLYLQYEYGGKVFDIGVTSEELIIHLNEGNDTWDFSRKIDFSSDDTYHLETILEACIKIIKDKQ